MSPPDITVSCLSWMEAKKAASFFRGGRARLVRPLRPASAVVCAKKKNINLKKSRTKRGDNDDKAQYDLGKYVGKVTIFEK